MLSPVQQQALRAPRSIGVHSVAFQHGKQIPREFTGRGDDINPPLSWTGVPSATQALAIVMDDADAPGTFTHWTLWNLPTRLEGIEGGANVIPLGCVAGRNSAGKPGYTGPDPSSGTHRYVFRVFALDKFLDLPPNAPAEDVWRALSTHTLAWGEIVGTFTKP